MEGLEFYPQETPTGANRSLNPDSGPGGVRGCGAPATRARPVAKVPVEGAAPRRPGTWSARYTFTKGASAPEAPFSLSTSFSRAPFSRGASAFPIYPSRPRPFFPPPDPPPARPSLGSPPSPRSSAGSSVLAPYPRPPLAGPPHPGPPRPPPRPPRGGGGPSHNSAARLPPLRSRFAPSCFPPGACALRSAAAAAVAATSGSVFLKGNAEAPGVTRVGGARAAETPRGGDRPPPGVGGLWADPSLPPPPEEEGGENGGSGRLRRAPGRGAGAGKGGVGWGDEAGPAGPGGAEASSGDELGGGWVRAPASEAKAAAAAAEAAARPPWAGGGPQPRPPLLRTPAGWRPGPGGAALAEACCRAAEASPPNSPPPPPSSTPRTSPLPHPLLRLGPRRCSGPL